MDGGLLRRVLGSELGLRHGQRDFPLETRALAIAIFYASGTLFGGAVGPILFGYLTGTGSRAYLFFGYALAGAFMITAAIVEALIGVKAERQSLESLAPPLAQGDEAT